MLPNKPVSYAAAQRALYIMNIGPTLSWDNSVSNSKAFSRKEKSMTTTSLAIVT